MKNFFTILGGMGTLASESFVRVLNSRTPAKHDQDYLNYVLVNHATVPDRTAYIIDTSLASPVTALKEDLIQQSILQPNFFVLTCNTAHTFYEDLQSTTDIPILHMPRLAAEKAAARVTNITDRKVKVGILATEGTISSNVYGQEFASERFEIVHPRPELQKKVTNLIYRDIKENKFLNQDLYHEILTDIIVEQGCDLAILGCTELSLMAEVAPLEGYLIIDAQGELVDKTIELALANRQE